MYDLSILIPSKNEEWLARTVDDILLHIEGNTEIIVVLDGWEIPVPDLGNDPRVTIITHNKSLGQRASVKEAARLSKSKYIAKVDAHCSFDQGFDVKMLDAFKITGDDVVMAPTMRNLHCFNWLCCNGHRRYQGPSGDCEECGEKTEKEVVWIAKTNPQSSSFCFDETPHFQYNNQWKKNKVYQEQIQKDGLVESMSLQGSFYMCSRERYFALDLDDESLGSWGSSGIESSCKFWLSGGRVVINTNTYYAHLFRTQADFGFPYKQDSNQVQGAKQKVKELFFDNKWHLQTRPLSWLLEKFAPVPGWSEPMLHKIKEWPLQNTTESRSTVGVLYYTDNCLDDEIALPVRDQIKRSLPKDAKLVSVSLKPIDFGQNIVINKERGILTMHEQILAGLEALDTDYVFFCEHDVLYHQSHFDFVPPDSDRFYYNGNIWRVRQSDGFAVSYDHKSLSQICANRKKLIEEYKIRVEELRKAIPNKMSYEPGTRSKESGGFSDNKAEFFYSDCANIDIRHDGNLTRSKWRQEDFRSMRSCRNWKETFVGEIEGWENLDSLVKNS